MSGDVEILTTLKILIIGESNVGKSSLLLRFTDDKFDPNLPSTIGVDFKTKTLNLDGNAVRLAIWVRNLSLDSACRLKFFSDVTSRNTFSRLEAWLNELETYSTRTDVVKMLVGNKIDKKLIPVMKKLYEKTADSKFILEIQRRGIKRYSYVRTRDGQPPAAHTQGAGDHPVGSTHRSPAADIQGKHEGLQYVGIPH
ncbi:unnamed protein product, partial [Darwinula stevensoni]